MKSQLLDLLIKASQAEFGIEVSTDDPERLRVKLYQARKGNPAFDELSFIIPDTPNMLHIMNKARYNGKAQTGIDEENP